MRTTRPRPAAAAAAPAPAEAEEAAGAFSRADRASILVSARLSELASCSSWCSPCSSARDCGRVLLRAGRSAPFLSLWSLASASSSLRAYGRAGGRAVLRRPEQEQAQAQKQVQA